MNERWLRLCWGAMGYDPNTTQANIIRQIINNDVRFALICGGERAGKSITSVAISLIFIDPTRQQGDFTYWIVGPDYAQARAEFAYFHKSLSALGMVDKVSMPETKTQPWIMHLVFGDGDWKATIETRTSSDISKLASFTVHGVLMVEAAQQTNDVWLKLRGRVAETRGWIILSGTLENGLPWYADMLERWEAPNDEQGQSFSLPTWSNTAIFPLGKRDPEIRQLRRTYPRDLFDERFGAKPRKKRGLVVPEFDFKKNVKALEFDPLKPVELFIDPAQHTYAVWFAQKHNQYIHVLDEVYEHGLTIYQIIPLVKMSPYWKYVTGGVIDVAGTQRHANKSQVQIWHEKTGKSLRFKKWPLDVLITTTRAYVAGWANPDSIINMEIQSSDETEADWEDRDEEFDPLAGLVPNVYFNTNLKTGVSPDNLAVEPLSEFSLWRWPRISDNSSNPKEPIDRNNDAIKALGYGLLDWYGPYTQKIATRTIQKQKYWV